MKLTRQQFLRVLPATVLALSGCAASETAPASTEELVFDHACPLDYATQFTADCYEGGYTMLTLTESGEQFLVTPEDAAEVEGLPESVTVLRQPIRNIYLVSTSVMDLFLALDGLDSVTLSGTQAEAGIWMRPEPPWRTGALPMRASTAPRITKRSLRPTAVLPLRTP